MPSISNTEQLHGLRAPTEDERDRLTLAFQYHYKTISRTCNCFGAIFAVLGLLCISGYKSHGWFALIAGLLFLGPFYGLILSKSREKRVLERISAGTFQVLDGVVQEYRNDIQTPYSCSVRFSSQYPGETLEKCLSVRYEGVMDGTPLLLVYVHDSPIRKVDTWLFTPFMLSDEGIQKHW